MFKKVCHFKLARSFHWTPLRDCRFLFVYLNYISVRFVSTLCRSILLQCLALAFRFAIAVNIHFRLMFILLLLLLLLVLLLILLLLPLLFFIVNHATCFGLICHPQEYKLCLISGVCILLRVWYQMMCVFNPSTQRHYRRLIYYLYTYIATCFGRTTSISCIDKLAFGDNGTKKVHTEETTSPITAAYQRYAI
jgi:hypothetical protein